MCLDGKWTGVDRDDWFEKQPKTITAYKIVVERKTRWLFVRRTRLAPPFYSGKFYKKRNRLRKKIHKIPIFSGRDNETYTPYYHLYLNIADAKETHAHIQLTRSHEFVKIHKIVKCEVPKKLITEIGFEFKKVVIITKGFTIIEEIS